MKAHVEGPNLPFRFLLHMGFWSWIMQTKMDDVYELDKHSRISEGKRSPDEVKLENMLLSFMIWLPDSDWISNWEYLMQTMMRIALSRENDRNPAFGNFTSRFIQEQIVTKRKLLPADQNVAVGMNTVYVNLTKLYLFDEAWAEMVTLIRQHIDELKNLEIGQVPEQISTAYFRMATAYNFMHDLENAKATLDRCFGVFHLQKLPPHRFKAHLLNIIELCYHHDRSEQPHFLGIHFDRDSGKWVSIEKNTDQDQQAKPNHKSNSTANIKPTLSFLSYAQLWYESLQQELPTIHLDHPWSSILEGLDARIMQQLEETKKQLESEGEIGNMMAENERIAHEKIRYYLNEILANPLYTPKQRISALKKILEDHAITEEEEKGVRDLIRKIRVAVAIPQDYVPKEHENERISRVRY